MMSERKPRPPRRSPAERRERHKKPRPPEESPDTPWRLFVAVPLPTEVRKQLAEVIDHLSPGTLPVRWIDPENGHITLHFLGDIEPEMAELLRMTLGSAVGGHSQFELRTTEPGAFPSLRRPRVLWLGLWGPTYKLEEIYNDLGDFLDDFGLEIEDAEFHPHITLGRVRSGEGVKVGSLPDQVKRAFANLAEKGLASQDRQVTLPVTEVQLIRSHLGKDGPRYEVLESYQLLKESQE